MLQKIFILGAAASLTAAAAFAAPDKPAQNAPALDVGAADTLIFSAPPRETYEVGREIYQPIVEYLSRVTGKRVVYKQPGNWLTYQTEMLKGGYDLVFDGPHFNSWRVSNLRHSVLAKFADEHTFVVVVRKDNTAIRDIKQLAGKKICGMNPPNLGTLALTAEFDNPSRQPVIIESMGWENIYQGVVYQNRCAAGILPLANLSKYDKTSDFTRVVHRTRTLPNQALSAGPRVTREDQARIAQALIAPEAAGPTAKLRAAYGSERGFARASRDEYAGLDAYLKDVWGYAR